MNRSATCLLLMLAAPLAALTPALAQGPTDAQKKAIKSDCRSDFIKHCSGVSPGGMPALECLEKNMDSLSASCQAAVKPVAAEVPASGG